MSNISMLVDAATGALPLHAVSMSALAAWLEKRTDQERAWLSAHDFKADIGSSVILPDEQGALRAVVVGLGKGDDPWAFGNLARNLPPRTYALSEAVGLAETLSPMFPTWAAQAWALGAYQFKRYKKTNVDAASPLASLVWPTGADRSSVERIIAATTLTRDLINTPAADMMPSHLAQAVMEVARAHGATVDQIVGDELLSKNYPMIHAVGRASDDAPRLIDMRWGQDSHPKVTLVGKGVCFDTGGLDLKPASGMALMKKDMGGAATVLGLAQTIMAAKLPVRLRVLIPAVENAVSGNAFRPSDVLPTRKGVTVEVGNTDAEGRLVLADALTEACSEKPTLLIDCATLTGAARTALGPDLPAVFTDDEALAADLAAAAKSTHDPLWRLPLWAPYRKMLDSKIADINNAGDSPFAGAITAALFLKEFVTPNLPWVHIDLFAWNKSSRPGRPEGGEAYGLRALHALIAQRIGV
jgi:leucyl aminopeptidase